MIAAANHSIEDLLGHQHALLAWMLVFTAALLCAIALVG